MDSFRKQGCGDSLAQMNINHKAAGFNSFWSRLLLVLLLSFLLKILCVCLRACLCEKCVGQRFMDGGGFSPSVPWACGLRQVSLPMQPSCQPYAML